MPAFARGRIRLSQSVTVRHSVLSPLASNDLATYAQAITLMKARSDFASWEEQAKIHDAHCHHRTPYFLPWHRAYLHRFEEIVRMVTGEPQFALPYWPYAPSSQEEDSRRLPPPFRDPASVLFDPSRNAAVNSGAALSSGTCDPSAAMQYASLLQDPQGQGFSRALEVQPHNPVHVDINGNMLTSFSPLDPIFWLHHAQIDRLWQRWTNDGGVNPGAGTGWGNTKMVGFSDTAGDPSEPRAGDLLDTSELGYVYDTDVATFFGGSSIGLLDKERVMSDGSRIEAAAPLVRLRGGQARINLESRRDEPLSILKLTQESPGRRVVLRLSGLTADRLVDTTYDVYLDLPPDTPPNPEGPHYVGKLALFTLGAHREGDHEHHHGGGDEIEYDITATASRLEQRGLGRGTGFSVVLIPTRPGVAYGEPVDSQSEIQIERAIIETR